MAVVEPYPGCELTCCRQPWASERAIMVGQAPSANGSADPRHALTGRPMQFLFSVCGIGLMEYVRTFERHNFIPHWHGYNTDGDSSSGSRFDHTRPENRRRRSELLLRAGTRRVVCWGRDVAKAMVGTNARHWDELSWYQEQVECEYDGRWYRPWAVFAILPHPSGLNRWWNEPAHRDAARAFIRAEVARVHAAKDAARA